MIIPPEDPPPVRNEHLLPIPGARPRSTPRWHWIFPGIPALIVILGLLAWIADAAEQSPLGALVLIGVLAGVGVSVCTVALVIRALIRVGDRQPPPVVIAAHPAPAPQLPPAGWYPDSEGAIRWFDGTRWTEFRQPGQS